MIWKILRPHFWMLDRRVRQANRVLVIAVLAGVPFLLQWAWTGLIRDQLALLNAEQLPSMIAGFIPLALMIMVSFALLGVGDVMSQLYLVSDLELLLVAPLRRGTIFMVKLLQCSRASVLPALLLAAVFFALGYAWEAEPSYYILIAVLLLMGMVLATALTMIVVMVIARVLPARYIRAWMPVMIGLGVFVLIFGQQWMVQWVAAQSWFLELLGGVTTSPGRLATVVLIAGGAALLAGLMAYALFSASFQEAWGRLREVPLQHKPAARARRTRLISRWLSPLREPTRSFVLKELLEFGRDPQVLMSLVNPLLMILVLILIPTMSMGSAREVLQPLFFWFILMVITLLAGTLPVGTSMMSVALEGRQIALLRSAPISMASMLKGKFWASYVPMAFSWTIVLVATGILLGFPAWQIGMLVGVAAWGTGAATLTALCLGGSKVDFDAEEPRQRIPMLISYITMAINTLFFLLTISTGIWIATRILPPESLDHMRAVLGGFSATGWLLADKICIPVLLLAGQVAFWIGAGLMWRAAVRRLESWEGG